MVTYLAGPEAGFVTGASLTIDGGVSAQVAPTALSRGNVYPRAKIHSPTSQGDTSSELTMASLKSVIHQHAGVSLARIYLFLPGHLIMLVYLEEPNVEVDNAKLEALMGRMIGELGAAINVPLMMIGDRLGLFKAMVEAGPLTSQQLAQKTGTDERYLREWLSAMAAGGIVTFDPASNTFTLPNEQALALAVDDSPVNLQGAFSVISSTYNDWEHLAEAFQTGRGVGWHEHHHSLFSGTDRFFRPGYKSHLISEWIPALDGIEQRLKAGAKVADVGCGFGSSTILMAQAFPNSRFFGFDYHDASVEAARRSAEAAGLAGRVTFEVASAKAFDGGGYDLIAVFDCLHDMGDPEGAARHIRKALKPDGAFMIVEPFAGDRLEDNLNPVGRMYYAASTMICTPGSRAQEVGACLGAQAGEARIKNIATNAGFTKFRRAAQTPFNLIYEARP